MALAGLVLSRTEAVEGCALRWARLERIRASRGLDRRVAEQCADQRLTLAVADEPACGRATQVVDAGVLDPGPCEDAEPTLASADEVPGRRGARGEHEAVRPSAVLRAAAEGYLVQQDALQRAVVELRAFADQRRVPVAPMASSGNEEPARRLSTRYT